MMKIKAVCLGICSLFLFCSAFAQDEDEKTCGKTTNKKALGMFADAKKEKDWEKCREKVDAAIEEEPTFPEAYLFLAERALKRNSLQIDLHLRKEEIQDNIQLMITSYKKLIEICPDFSAKPYLDLGTYYFLQKQYDESIKYLRDFRKKEKATEPDLAYADSLVRIAKLLKNPVPFDPKPVAGISTDKDEYLPIITADNELAFYTRSYQKLRRGDLFPTLVEEFTFSNFDTTKHQFTFGDAMPSPFNRNNNEGGATVTLDNNHLYFTVCKDTLGTINCDIWHCEKKNGNWGPLAPMGPEINDPKMWDSQPCISRDGNTLYFSSIRSEEMKSDIYYSKKDRSGRWSKAEPLGAPVNTKGDEKSPFLHPDDKTLYFSSDGHPGMGGFDIYYCRRDSTGKFSSIKNIGYPINSANDELGFFVSTNGTTGYFASNKLVAQSKGGWDVFSFPLYEEARPGKVLFVKGELAKDDRDTSLPVAKVEIKNTVTKEVTRLEVDSSSGKYVGVVNFENDMVLTMKREGYAFQSGYFSAQDSSLNEKPVKLDLNLNKLEVGGVFRLQNINYKTNSAELTEESELVVDEFIQYLKENPGVSVEIRGHTDNVGDEKKNLALSTDRAFTVYEHALNAGVDKSRISFKGFGKSKPVASNDTEKGRALNRRTEFVIIGK